MGIVNHWVIGNKWNPIKYSLLKDKSKKSKLNEDGDYVETIDSDSELEHKDAEQYVGPDVIGCVCD